MLEHIVLRNFKSIAHADLKLRNLNILIGPNGAGKSNFLKFFFLLRQAADGYLNNIISKEGGFAQLIHYAALPNEMLDWSLTFQDVIDEQTIYYTGQLRRLGTSSYSVKSEELERPPYPNYRNNYKFLSVSGGQVRILRSRTGDDDVENTTDYDESEQELAISQIRNRVRYPKLYALREMIADWQIFRGFGDSALNNIRAPQQFNVVEPLRLASSGQNLVSVLQQIANEPRYGQTNTQIFQAMSSVFPDFVKFDIPISAGGTGSLYYRSSDFSISIPATSMSDGQLRFLGLVILLLLPNPPPLIVIDEPELGLHPQMLSVLAELLKQASMRTQLIVITHSPQLIDAVAPEDIIVVERENGNTTLERLDTDHLDHWLERYTLGKLWTMGKLETQ